MIRKKCTNGNERCTFNEDPFLTDNEAKSATSYFCSNFFLSFDQLSVHSLSSTFHNHFLPHSYFFSLTSYVFFSFLSSRLLFTITNIGNSHYWLSAPQWPFNIKHLYLSDTILPRQMFYNISLPGLLSGVSVLHPALGNILNQCFPARGMVSPRGKLYIVVWGMIRVQ